MRSTLLTGALIGVVAILLLGPAISRRSGAAVEPRSDAGLASSAGADDAPWHRAAWLEGALDPLARGEAEAALAVLDAQDAGRLPPAERQRHLFLTGLAARRAGRLDRAGTALTDLLRGRAKQRYVLASRAALLLAEVRSEAGDLEGALAALHAASPAAGPVATAELAAREAEILEAAGRHGEALSALQPLLERGHPSRPEALASAIRLAEAAGGAGAALELRRSAWLDHPASEAGLAAGRHESLRGEAARLAALGRHEELLARGEALLAARQNVAAAACGAAVRDVVADPLVQDRAELLLGRAHRQAKQPARALPHLQSVSERDADLRARATLNRALAARTLGRIGEAERLAAQVADGPPGPWRDEAAFTLAEWRRPSDVDEAIRLWRLVARDGLRDDDRAKAGWLAAWTLHREGRSDEALVAMDLLAREAPRSRHAGASLYWAARIARASGDDAGADERLITVSHRFPNDWYGALAARELGTECQVPSACAPSEDDQALHAMLDALAGADAETVRRVRELALLGLADEAAAELDALSLVETAPAEQREAAWQARVVLLGRSGRYLDALRTLRRGAPDWRCRTDIPPAVWDAAYPLAFDELVQEHCAERGLDPALVHALIHQESVYLPEARSWAGARGLMQIMPGTGRTIARWFGEKIRTSDLLDPELNVRYGTEYLARLIDQFGREELALAGYNAGGGRVRAWKRSVSPDDIALFVEEVPFDETRDYVKAIGWNRLYYARRLASLDSDRVAARIVPEADGEDAGVEAAR